MAAHPNITPAIAPISNPPTLDNTSTASFGFGLLSSIDFLITSALCFNNSFFNPAPIPVISLGSQLSNTDIIAVDGVVLAIPISPIPINI